MPLSLASLLELLIPKELNLHIKHFQKWLVYLKGILSCANFPSFIAPWMKNLLYGNSALRKFCNAQLDNQALWMD